MVKDKSDVMPEDFKVAETYPHPKYSPDSHYHNIALIKLDRNITKFNKYIRPACIRTLQEFYSYGFDYHATGLNSTDHGKDMHMVLQKTKLNVFPDEKCLPTYKPQEKLEKGINVTTQLCAGNSEEVMDTCQVNESNLPFHKDIRNCDDTNFFFRVI